MTFLVVDATFRNLDSTRKTEVSSESVAIIDEDGKIFTAEGGGSKSGGYCASCTITTSTERDELALGFVFVIEEDAVGQVFKFQFQ